MADTLDVRREGAVTTVIMHRGGNNAISNDLVADLKIAFEDLGKDPVTRVIVLASEYEKYFSVGADLGNLGAIDREAPDAADRIIAMVRPLLAGFGAIESCPKPVIAAINGHALGGGCELALSCDYRIMVEDGRSLIGQTEVALGITPGAGGTQRLTRLIGKARALPLMIEGTRLSARQAEAIGLISQAAEPADFTAVVAALSDRLARSATFAIAMIKDAVNQGQDIPLPQALDLEAANFARACLSQDAVIGLMAFFAKQPPEFTGT